jgi:hypothetical protein
MTKKAFLLVVALWLIAVVMLHTRSLSVPMTNAKKLRSQAIEMYRAGRIGEINSLESRFYHCRTLESEGTVFLKFQPKVREYRPDLLSKVLLDFKVVPVRGFWYNLSEDRFPRTEEKKSLTSPIQPDPRTSGG